MKQSIIHQNRRNFSTLLVAIALTAPQALHAVDIVGDTVQGNLKVTGVGVFDGGIDFGDIGQSSLFWDSGSKIAISDIHTEAGSFLWRDTVIASPLSERNKMKLDSVNNLTLYKSDGTAAVVIDPTKGSITLPSTGTNNGIFFGTNATATLKAAANGSAIFPSSVTLQGTSGVLKLEGTAASTSSTTGALTVAGGLGVGKDAFINGLRIGRGAGNIATNTTLGAIALNANTSGLQNTAIGGSALRSNTSGSNNSTTGSNALYSNTTGGSNTASGAYALYANTTGSSNVALGTLSGRYHANGTTALTDPDNSIYIGTNSRGKDNNDNNSIVIGANAIGEGANTTVIGNSATTNTHLYGNLVTGGITSAGSPVLTNASAFAEGFVTFSDLQYSAISLSGGYAYGEDSTAMTWGTANDYGSTAMSWGTANGSGSTAMSGGSANSDYSTAMSFGTANGSDSTAMSWGTANGSGSTGMSGGSAISDYSTAMSYGYANGNYSTAMSFGSATGSGSTAMSYGNALGQYSTALTYGTTYGEYSLAAGVMTNAPSFSETVIGSYNAITSGNSSSWDPNDPVLQVGNGHDYLIETQTQTDLNGDGNIDQNWSDYLPLTNSNALTVYKSGNVDIQGNLTLGGTITSNGSEVLTQSSVLNFGYVTSSDVNTQINNEMTNGVYSALSENVSISGGYSNGNYSTAMSNGYASADYSTAMSNGYASADYSTAMSSGAATSSFATAMSAGYADAAYATAISEGHAYGHASTAMSGGHANGYYSAAMTYGYANGDYSTAMSNGIANGYYSIAAGQTQVSSFSAAAFGHYNEDRNVSGGTTWSGTSQDSVFEVGIGTNLFNRANALTVLQDGSVEIGKDATDGSIPLQVKSDGTVVLTKPQGDISMGAYE
jgi:hypothetical protein